MSKLKKAAAMSESSDTGGCILVPIAAITACVGVGLWVWGGYDPKEAAGVGLLSGVGLCCGAPIALGLVVGVVYVYRWATQQSRGER